MELQVGVKILLKNREGKFLLLKRSPGVYPEAANQWDIPGGRINPGTPLLDNLKREILEETQLTFTGEVQLLAAQDILRNPEKHVVRLTYLGEMEGEPVLDKDHSDFQWFALEELRKLENLDPYIREIISTHFIS